jgi:hypothetical protein
MVDCFKNVKFSYENHVLIQSPLLEKIIMSFQIMCKKNRLGNIFVIVRSIEECVILQNNGLSTILPFEKL